MTRPSPLSRPGPRLQSGLGPPLSGDVITYDNTTSGLTADDVQEAIDELAALSGGIDVTDGTTTVSPTTTLDFDPTYFDVTAPGGDVAEVTFIGPSGGITVQDEGTPLATDATTLNFTGSGVTASGAGATKTINVSGGGGGLAHSFLGYNTVGGSWEVMTDTRQYCKKITMAGDGLLASVEAYMRPSTDNVGSIIATVLQDNSNAPGILRGASVAFTGQGGAYLSNSSSMPGAGRWFSLAINAYLTAGDYWICVIQDAGNYDLAYDGSGSDQHFTPSLFIATGAYPSAWSITTGSRVYSMRASILS